MNKIFFPQYKKGRKGIALHEGLSVLEYLRKAGIEINSQCGGRGRCGKCVVRVGRGEKNLNKRTKTERKFPLSFQERLACQAKISPHQKLWCGDVAVFIKESGKYQILKDTLAPNRPPSKQWRTGSGFGLNPLTISRNGKVIHDGKVIDKYKGKIYGLAVDVGTTTLVFQIINLQTGEIVKTIAKTNPQIVYGGDVISRIEYAIVHKNKLAYLSHDERRTKLKELQKCVMDSINESLKKFKNITPHIYEAVIVGNSTMRSIFFGIDVFSLGLRPYEPINKGPSVKRAKEIGLKISPKGRVYGAPLIGGHAGSDTLANILASGIYENKKVSMLVDIGTNGEVVIGNSKRLISATLPAGGAFEGASVSSGVGAIEGAIKNVRIKNGKVIYETIGDKKPIGICGSGLIDLLAELLKSGMMDENAKIRQDFKITNKIKLTQPDIYQLVNAKASLKIDQLILLKHYSIDVKDLAQIYLSGGFGNYINIKNAIRIELLPDAEKKIVKIGNGALAGAREMLVSKDSRKTAEKIAEQTHHIKPNELEKDFNSLLAENMYFES